MEFSKTSSSSGPRRRHSPKTKPNVSELGLLGQALYKTRRNASRIRTTDVSLTRLACRHARGSRSVYMIRLCLLTDLPSFRKTQLPYEIDAIGYYSPWAMLWFFIFSVAPFCYVYILLMLLRDLCLYFPESVQQPLEHYVPFLARLANHMNSSSKVMEVWCVIEAMFFILIQCKIQYLQSRDPLEASLSAAPMLDPADRKVLWDRMLDAEQEDPISFLSGWFFDMPIENISRYDVFDFVCWSMFDGRNQEHLTLGEEKELEEFVDDLEIVISLHLYGAVEGEQGVDDIGLNLEDDDDDDDDGTAGAIHHMADEMMDHGEDVMSELTNENDENNAYHHNKKTRKTLEKKDLEAHPDHLSKTSVETETKGRSRRTDAEEDNSGEETKVEASPDNSFFSMTGKPYPQPKKSKRGKALLRVKLKKGGY
jgi:hypothetical protein